LVLHTYVLRVQYNCGVVLVFWSWREIVTDVTYVLSVQYNCAVVSVVARNSSQNENTFLQKNLIGLLYYDPIADYKTKHSFTLYLSILYISLVPHRFAR
jgi:hypothetical protein